MIKTKEDFDSSSNEERQMYASKDPEWMELCKRLQCVAPGQVIPTFSGDNYLKLILEVGKVMDASILNIHGDTESSNSNVADLLDKHEKLKENRYQRLEDIPTKLFHLTVGYVYTESDKTWRKHSWILSDLIIIETCEPGDKYFGLVLAGADRSRFRLLNATTKAYQYSIEARFFTTNKKCLDYRSEFIKKRDGMI